MPRVALPRHWAPATRSVRRRMASGSRGRRGRAGGGGARRCGRGSGRSPRGGRGRRNRGRRLPACGGDQRREDGRRSEGESGQALSTGTVRSADSRRGAGFARPAGPAPPRSFRQHRARPCSRLVADGTLRSPGADSRHAEVRAGPWQATRGSSGRARAAPAGRTSTRTARRATTTSQDAAAAQARKELNATGGGELIIQGENGRIRQKDTIGKPDPRGSVG